MLDLKTVLLVTLAISTLQAFIWLVAWRSAKEMIALRLYGFGFAMISLGVLAMIWRGTSPTAASILIHNMAIKIGLVLLAEGLGRFLNAPSKLRLGGVALLAYGLFWAAALHFAPESIALRIHSSTLFTLVIMAAMCRDLWRVRGQSTALHGATIAVLLAYMGASLLQSWIEYRLPTGFQSEAILANRHSWYLLQGTLFLIAFFACSLIMLAMRLAEDLRQHNLALSDEVAKRRALEAQLATSLDVERALREEQGDFTRLVGHEFRTALAMIRNALDMLDLGAPIAPEAGRRLASMREAVGRMFQLIDRFMSDEREAGAHLEWQRSDELMAGLQLHFALTGHDERLDFVAESAPIWLYIDPEMIEAALVNLIDNALKYSAPPRVVTVSIRALAHGAEIEILDQGIGIPAQDLPKIGRRFFRGSNAPSGTGTGIGLHLTQKLLGYHQAQLSLQPGPEGGTLARIILPVPRGLRPGPPRHAPAATAVREAS